MAQSEVHPPNSTLPSISPNQLPPQMFSRRNRLLLSPTRSASIDLPSLPRGRNDRTRHTHQLRLPSRMAEIRHAPPLLRTDGRHHDPVPRALEVAVRPVRKHIPYIHHYWRRNVVFGAGREDGDGHPGVAVGAGDIETGLTRALEEES